MWIRNVQMGMAGMCMALVVAAMRDTEQVVQLTLLHDWGQNALGITFAQAVAA